MRASAGSVRCPGCAEQRQNACIVRPAVAHALRQRPQPGKHPQRARKHSSSGGELHGARVRHVPGRHLRRRRGMSGACKAIDSLRPRRTCHTSAADAATSALSVAGRQAPSLQRSSTRGGDSTTRALVSGGAAGAGYRACTGIAMCASACSCCEPGSRLGVAGASTATTEALHSGAGRSMFTSPNTRAGGTARTKRGVMRRSGSVRRKAPELSHSTARTCAFALCGSQLVHVCIRAGRQRLQQRERAARPGVRAPGRPGRGQMRRQATVQAGSAQHDTRQRAARRAQDVAMRPVMRTPRACAPCARLYRSRRRSAASALCLRPPRGRFQTLQPPTTRLPHAARQRERAVRRTSVRKAHHHLRRRVACERAAPPAPARAACVPRGCFRRAASPHALRTGGGGAGAPRHASAVDLASPSAL